MAVPACPGHYSLGGVCFAVSCLRRHSLDLSVCLSGRCRQAGGVLKNLADGEEWALGSCGTQCALCGMGESEMELQATALHIHRLLHPLGYRCSPVRQENYLEKCKTKILKSAFAWLSVL